MFDFGDPVPLAVTVKDSNGAAANAGDIALTVTLPDLTTATPSVSNPSAGSYTATYTPTQAGRHVARWVATGANASAFVDVFDVRQSSPPYIVSLADAKKAMNWTTTDDDRDEEFRRYVEGATVIVEGEVGPVVVRSVVERHPSGECLVLKRKNPLSLTSVEGWFTTSSSYDVADLELDTDTGIVERNDGSYFTGGPFRVTYRVGMTVIPATISISALDLIRINFRPQQGGNRGLFDSGEGEFRPDLGMFIPNSVISNLQAHADVAGFA